MGGLGIGVAMAPFISGALLLLGGAARALRNFYRRSSR